MRDSTAKKPEIKPGGVYSFFKEISNINHLCNALMGKIMPEGLHPSHFAIIEHLTRVKEGKTPLHLARTMQVTKATMSHSLKVLEKRGLVEILPCTIDARSKLVYLTVSGWAFHAEAIAASVRTFRHFLHDEHREIMGQALPDLIAIRKLLEDNREPWPEDDDVARPGAPTATSGIGPVPQIRSQRQG